MDSRQLRETTHIVTNIIVYSNHCTKRDSYVREWYIATRHHLLFSTGCLIVLSCSKGQDHHQCSTDKLHILTEFMVNHTAKGRIFFLSKANVYRHSTKFVKIFSMSFSEEMILSVMTLWVIYLYLYAPVKMGFLII